MQNALNVLVTIYFIVFLIVLEIILKVKSIFPISECQDTLIIFISNIIKRLSDFTKIIQQYFHSSNLF